MNGTLVISFFGTDAAAHTTRRSQEAWARRFCYYLLRESGSHMRAKHKCPDFYNKTACQGFVV